MKSFRRVSAWVLATVIAGASLAKAASPLDDKVPADSIIYMGWAGSDALEPQYAQSNLKGIVDASAAKQFINQQLPKLIDMAGQGNPQAAQHIAKLQTALTIVWQRPGAFYFCPMDFSNPRNPGLRMGIICEAGGDAKTLAELLTEALSQMPPQRPNEPQFKVTNEAGIVAFTIGKADTAAERAAGGGLAAVAEYKKTNTQIKVAKPAMSVYVDVTKTIAMVNDAIAKTNPPQDVKDRLPAVIDALGANSLTQVAASSGFDGKEWTQQAFFGVNGPRKGVLKLMGEAPLDNAMLAVVPKDAVAFATLKLDPSGIFNEVRAVAAKIDPSATREIDTGLAQANQQLGMDIQKEIIAPFGEDWIIYRAPLSDIGGQSFAMVHKLRDGEQLAATIAKAETMINTLGQGRFKIDKLTASKIEFSSVSFLQYSAAWTVRNGYLYVSTVDGLPGAVKQVENKLPSIVENDLYKKALASLPQGVKPLTIAYSNPAKIYPELRRLALGLLPLARAGGFDIPAGVLPDIDDVAAFMTPGATISWWDADGLHIAGRSAFPGAEFVGGGQAGSPMVVAVAGMGTAVLMPALGRSRELANRSVDAANLRGIAVSCLVHAADNNDRMPDDLARLVLSGSASPRMLVNRWSGTQPLNMTPELEQLAKSDFPKFAAALAASCDYVYVGKGTTNRTDASVIIAYDKPAPYLTEGMNLAYQDGHVEYIRWNGVAGEFAKTNEALKKQGLPEVDVADLYRKAGQPVPPGVRGAGGGLP